MSEDNVNVKVFCRVRPPNEREKRLSATPTSSFAGVNKCISVPASDPNKKTIVLHLKNAQNQNPPFNKPFTYDRIFDEDSTQEDVFQVVGMPITRACLQGYNGTIFAYGQTGSGKTFTMQGPDDAILSNVKSEDDMRGLVPRVFDYLYNTEAAGRNQDNQETHDIKDGNADVTHHRFTCSFLEIYNERVYDLLESKGNSTMSTTASIGLPVRENNKKGVFVEGLTVSEVDSARKAAELMKLGAQNRRVGQTAMNRESSRSHSVFILNIESTENVSTGLKRTRSSKFSLVDLAGSERQKNAESFGDRLKEAGSINKSLSALGNVIMGLVNKSAGKACHVHFRDSKLTFLLKDSLGGNSKTFMIATISPTEDSANETLSTLKFAQRAKLIRNQAFINEDTSGDVINLQQEVQRLRLQLSMQGQCNASRIPTPIDRVLQLDDKAFDEDDDTNAPACTDLFDNFSKDIRLKELECTLAIIAEESVKYKSGFQKSLEKEQQLSSICECLKRKLQHSKLLLKFASDKLSHQQCEESKSIQDLIDREMTYEPSIDAIEWRLKFEKMEEAYARLNASYEKRAESADSGMTFTELSGVDDCYRALSKQFAHVLYDKHFLERQLSRHKENVLESIPSDKASEEEVQYLLKIQAQEYEAKLSAAIQVQISLEQKAASVANDLLRSKQRETAWSVRYQDTERQYSEAMFMFERECTTSNDLRNQLLTEKQRMQELILEKDRERLVSDHNQRLQVEAGDSHEKLMIMNQWLKVQLQLLSNHRHSLDNVIDHLHKEKVEAQSNLDSASQIVSELRSKDNVLLAELTQTNNRNIVLQDQLKSKQSALIAWKKEFEDAQSRLKQTNASPEKKISLLESQLYHISQEALAKYNDVKHESDPLALRSQNIDPNQFSQNPTCLNTSLVTSEDNIVSNVPQPSTTDSSFKDPLPKSDIQGPTQYIIKRDGESGSTRDRRELARDQYALLKKIATLETEKLILKRDLSMQNEKLEKVEATLRLTKQDLMLEKRLRSEDVMQLAAFKNKLEILVAQFKQENDDLQDRFSQLEFEFVKNKRMLEESLYKLNARDQKYNAAKQVFERLLMEATESNQRLHIHFDKIVRAGYIPSAHGPKLKAFNSTSDPLITPIDNMKRSFFKMQADLEGARTRIEATNASHDVPVGSWRSQLDRAKRQLDQALGVAAAKEKKLQELEKRCVMLTRLAENRSMLLTTYEEEVAAAKAAKIETEKDLLRIRRNLGDLGHLLDRHGQSGFEN